MIMIDKQRIVLLSVSGKMKILQTGDFFFFRKIMKEPIFLSLENNLQNLIFSLSV